MEAMLKTWDLYFLAEDFTIFNAEVTQIMEIRKHTLIPPDELQEIARTGIYECPFLLYLKMGKPSQIKCISCAVSERIYDEGRVLVFITTRIKGAPIAQKFTEINTNNVGTLVGILGTVCRVGYRKIENLEAIFECTKCTKITKDKIANNIYKQPSCPCKGRTQVFLQDHPDNKCTDRQEIRIQELFGTGTNTATIGVDISGGLVGSVAPGDVVEITGIVIAEKIEDAYKLKIEGNNLHVIKGREIKYHDVDLGHEEANSSESSNINAKCNEDTDHKHAFSVGAPSQSTVLELSSNQEEPSGMSSSVI